MGNHHTFFCVQGFVISLCINRALHKWLQPTVYYTPSPRSHSSSDPSSEVSHSVSSITPTASAPPGPDAAAAAAAASAAVSASAASAVRTILVTTFVSAAPHLAPHLALHLVSHPGMFQGAMQMRCGVRTRNVSTRPRGVAHPPGHTGLSKRHHHPLHPPPSHSCFLLRRGRCVHTCSCRGLRRRCHFSHLSLPVYTYQHHEKTFYGSGSGFVVLLDCSPSSPSSWARRKPFQRLSLVSSSLSGRAVAGALVW